MFRRRPRNQATGEAIAIAPPVMADFDARLGERLAVGRQLGDAARRVRTQREYQQWSDALLEWRGDIAETLGAGFATSAARDALLEIWSNSAPLCTTWLDSFKADRATLNAALDFAERVREASAPFSA
jgi:hypothetical protein